MTKVTVAHSAQIAAMSHCGASIQEISKHFTYSRATIYRHMRQVLGSKPMSDKRKMNTGRPRRLSIRDERRILRAIPRLRKLEGGFSSKRIAIFAGIDPSVSSRTICRVLNKHGFGFYQTRKKGLLTEKDRKLRVKFCRKIKKLKAPSFWKDGISFYLDGTGFTFKTRPYDQARAPSSREWRKKSEGLRITSKGKKEGTVNANFMVGISYNRGVVLCEQYKGSITGEKFANIVKTKFREALARSSALASRRVLQDGCPRQNSRIAKAAFADVKALLFKIPPRSPDLNPIGQSKFTSFKIISTHFSLKLKYLYCIFSFLHRERFPLGQERAGQTSN